MTTLLRTQNNLDSSIKVDSGGFGYNSKRATERERRASQDSIASTVTIDSNQSSSRSQYAVILVLSSLNNTFDKKSLIIPFYPEVVKLGRQTNAKTCPAPDNGYFDSRVLSRQHAEVWAQKSTGKVFIKDVKSSNGTYINRERLSVENTESEPRELKKNDTLELGIDISGDDGSTLVHRKIAARVDRISIMGLQVNNSNNAGSSNSSLNGSLKSQKISSGSNYGANQNNLLSIQSNGSLVNGSGMGHVPAFANKSDILDASLWGDVDSTLEDLIMGHANSSVAGALLKPAVTSTATFESTVKKLISEMHAAKLEGAKLKSVADLLDEIRVEQKKSGVLNALSDQISIKEAYLAEVELRNSEQATLKSVQEELKNKTVLYDQVKEELAQTKEQLNSAQTKANELADEVLRLKNELEQSKVDSELGGSRENQRSPNENEIMVTSSVIQKGLSSGSLARVVPVSTALGVVVAGVAIMAILRDHFDRSNLNL